MQGGKENKKTKRNKILKANPKRSRYLGSAQLHIHTVAKPNFQRKQMNFTLS